MKNQPFIVQLGTALRKASGTAGVQLPLLDFNKVIVEAKLLYDTPEQKEVDFIKVKPFEYSALATTDGSKCTLEFMIKVLSSQHEDTNFLLRLQALDPVTRTPLLPGFSVLSHPVKVISKPEVIKPKAERPKKRTREDVLLETLSRIEEQQLRQQEILQRLCESTSSLERLADLRGPSKRELSSSLTSSSHLPLLPPISSEHVPMDVSDSQLDPSLEFENAYRSLLSAYARLDEEERPKKIRRVMESTDEDEKKSMAGLMEHFANEGMGKLGHVCDEACVHVKTELDQLDLFYNEFLSIDSFANPPSSGFHSGNVNDLFMGANLL